MFGTYFSTSFPFLLWKSISNFIRLLLYELHSDSEPNYWIKIRPFFAKTLTQNRNCANKKKSKSQRPPSNAKWTIWKCKTSWGWQPQNWESKNRDKQPEKHPEATHSHVCMIVCDRTIVTMITIYESENVLSIAYVYVLCTTILLISLWWSGGSEAHTERAMRKPEKPNRIYRYNSP